MLTTTSAPHTRTTSALRLVDVGKRYPNGDEVNDALRGVSLTLPTGSFTAVMGPSGSAKSTLLQIAAGLDTPTRGQIVVGGREINGLGADALTRFRRDHIGFVFQAYNLIDHLSVLDNVALPLLLAGERPEPLWQERLLTAVGLHGLGDRRPVELSGGQAQRVAIARALVTRPDIVFADEPTGALDSHTADQVLALLRDTARDLHQTVVLVTHDPRVATTAERVLFLADGRLVDELEAPTVDRIAQRMTALGR